MHPSRSNIRKYCDRRLEGSAAQTIAEHLDICEFCREYADEHRALSRSLAEAASGAVPSELAQYVDDIHRRALSSLIVRLKPSLPTVPQEQPLLAADGGRKQVTRLENLGTLYSEDPEVVLRIMRDNVRNREYLQLVSEDETLVSQVLVQVPECNLSILTDQDGRGDLEWKQIEDITRYRWHVKLPDAEVSLAPLQYDPDALEYHAETVLKTNRGDLLGIRFEGRTESKRLTIRILSFAGRDDFAPVRVVVSQAAETVTRSLTRQESLELELSSPQDLISIRLFSE